MRTAYDTYWSLLPSCSFTGSLTWMPIHLPFHSAGSRSVAAVVVRACDGRDELEPLAAALTSAGGGETGEIVSKPSLSSSRGDAIAGALERGGASSHAIEWKPSSSSGWEDMASSITGLCNGDARRLTVCIFRLTRTR